MGTVRAGEHNEFYGKGNKNHQLGTGSFIHHRIVQAVKRGCWCNIIVLNVHAPSEQKSDDSKDSYYEELVQVFEHFPKYYRNYFRRF